MYNLSFMDTNNTFLEVFQSVNTESAGVIVSLILFSLFIIILVALKHYDSKVTFLVASFITTIVGILFMFMGMVGMNILFIFIVGMIASLLYYLFGGD